MIHEYCCSFEDIELRPLTIADSQRYRELRNREENRNSFFSDSIITEEQQNRWYENYMNDESDIMFSIWNRNAFIGGVALYDITGDQHPRVNEERCAEFGRLLIDRKIYRNHGGVKACKAALAFGFGELMLDRIYLSVYENNVYARNVYESVGFSTDSLIRNEDGKRVVSMSICSMKKAGDL